MTGRSPALSADIADAALASAGAARIAWAESQMPVLRQVRARFEGERPLGGVVIAACLHVTPETAVLVRTLQAGGADVALCASNPLSTQDDAAAALVERYGVEVHARAREDAGTYYRHIDAVLDRGPRITIDDGADLIGVIHGRRTDLVEGILGGTEETTTGMIRLRALEEQGKLAFPVIAVAEAITGRQFDHRYGTGQSTLDGILRATNILLAGQRVVVFGYGSCGKGVALRARGAGAHVVVCEVDDLRALEAVMDGYDVKPARDAAAEGDVFITVTGNRDVIRREHFELMRDGAIVANAGHFDVEVSKPDLAALTVESREVRPLTVQHVMADGRRIHLLADGRVVNLAAGEGHPGAVMDVDFANQALCIEHLVRTGEQLEPRVHGVPEAIDREVARLKLESLGTEIDALTDEQRRYLHSWEQGT
ncbi:MAG: adenosylhomocysteinase [Thermoleophilaceae bacterium]|nr:adenosylhomocysteinase [Thermoleophilaceae bacterium]